MRDWPSISVTGTMPSRFSRDRCVIRDKRSMEHRPWGATHQLAAISELLAAEALYRLRAVMSVIGLTDKYDPGRLEAACTWR
jgi:hypothetical protein